MDSDESAPEREAHMVEKLCFFRLNTWHGHVRAAGRVYVDRVPANFQKSIENSFFIILFFVKYCLEI